MADLRRLFLAIILLAGGIASGQPESTLLLEEKPEVKVRFGTPAPPAPKSSEPAAPTPDPSDLLVAIVNSHVLTKAEINARVSARYEELKANIQKSHGGVITVVGPMEMNTTGVHNRLTGQYGTGSALRNRLTNENFDEEGNPIFTTSEAMKSNELLEGQEEVLEAAMRRAEEDELQTWMEHNILADEARRQGIIVSEGEFRRRLEEAEHANELESAEVDAVLKELRISREDYQKYVYDALMIEKLLLRFIDLNYTEAFFRERYESNPQLFYEPERFLIAHFVITLDGSENRNMLKNLRERANEVRKALKDGADPEQFFSKERYNQIDAGIFGSVPGWFTFYEGYLPPVVEYEAQRLAVGETSNVLVQQMKGTDGKLVPKSIHVIKILDNRPATGQTFESAKPAIDRAMLEVARGKLLKKLNEAKTHRVVTNLGGIPPRLIPSPEDLMRNQASANPVNLKLQVKNKDS